MRILLVYDHLDTGGAQTHGLGLSQELIRAGHTVAVASRGGNTAPRFAQVGAQVLEWLAPRRTNPAGLLRSYRQARQILRQWRPAVIHAHAVLPGVVFSFAARSQAGPWPPSVFTPHRSWHSVYHFPGGGLLSWPFYQLLRLNADEVIAVSEGLQQELIQHGIDRAHCHLIRNGIDVSLYSVQSSPNTSQQIVVGTIGRLIEQKGMDVFIDAAAQIAERRPDVEFQIAGEGPLREQLTRQIAARGLIDRVQLLGNQSDVPEVLQQMSVFVSASRWEGMPYALLEALAARRPVVATRVLGSAELIQDGVTGLLVPPADPTALSAAILRLLDDRALARMLAEAGEHLVERKYNRYTMAAQIVQVYQNACDRSLTAHT